MKKQMNMIFSLQQIQNAAHELTKKSKEWDDTVSEIKKCCEQDDCPEQMRSAAERLLYAGNVIRTYAEILNDVSDRYEENEKSILHTIEI